MKRYIICGNCETDSKIQIYKFVGRGFGIEVRRIPFVLGEVLEDGGVSIKRAHKGYTIITGDKFTLRCARCGSEVYKKEINGTIATSSYRESRLFGGTFSESVGTSGTYSLNT